MPTFKIPIEKLQYEPISTSFSITKKKLNELHDIDLIDRDTVFVVIGKKQEVAFVFSSCTPFMQYFRPERIGYNNFLLIVNYD